jgi:YidC/Oxa1 family membrane protein insertase
VWDTIIIQPILNVLLLLYKFFGHETIIAVALVTLLFRLILTPLQLNQQKSTRKQRELQPKLKELQVKYKDNREQLAQEQMKLYREAGINPTGGCLTLLIQLPIMLGLYQAIIRALASTPLQLLALPQDIYNWIPAIDTLIPLKSRFLWLDLALPDPFYILPILVVISAWFYQKLITPPPTDTQAEAMNKQMMIMMPLMTGFFAATYASGLAVYFLISNLVGILQYYLFRQHYRIDETAKSLASSKPRVKEKKQA